jgi:exosortase
MGHDVNNTKPTGSAQTVNRLSKGLVAAVAFCAALIVWVFWPTAVELAEIWSNNPLYSHGYLIPAFAAALLWMRRDRLPGLPFRPSLWGLAFILLGVVMRLGAAYFYIAWPERAALIPILLGAGLCLGGWAAFRWVWPSALFLLFMVPLPGELETRLIQPLQRLSTLASTNVLQTLGFFAQADGNVIVLSEVELGVVEACSGLRMLSVFAALSVAVAIVLRRPLWQRLLVAFSALPIAVLCNVARISVTGVLYEVADPHLAEMVFHDVAGWLMMPLALVALLAELKLLSAVYVPETKQTPGARPAPGAAG